MKYKGLTIVQEFIGYEVWGLDDNGQPETDIQSYDNESNGYQVWDWKNSCQHEVFPESYDTLEEVKAAINSFKALERIEANFTPEQV